MTIEQILRNEIQESKRWLDNDTAEGVYKRDLVKRIELINWVLEQMKNPDIFICEAIECKMNNIIDKINKINSLVESDPLDSELSILDWIFFQICKMRLKSLKGYNLS